MRSKTGGPVCFYCGKNGHIKRFCPELKKKNSEVQEQVEKRDPEIANFSNAVDSDLEEIDCIALVSEVKMRKSG